MERFEEADRAYARAVEVDPDVGQEVLNGEVVAKVVNVKTKKIATFSKNKKIRNLSQ